MGTQSFNILELANENEKKKNLSWQMKYYKYDNQLGKVTQLSVSVFPNA